MLACHGCVLRRLQGREGHGSFPCGSLGRHGPRSKESQPCKANAHGPCMPCLRGLSESQASAKLPSKSRTDSWIALSGPRLGPVPMGSAQQMRSWLMRRRSARLVVKMAARPPLPPSKPHRPCVSLTFRSNPECPCRPICPRIHASKPELFVLHALSWQGPEVMR